MRKSADELFSAALALTNAAERASLLDRGECAGNPALRAEVESLLAAHDQAGTFFEEPGPTVMLDVSVEKPGDRIGRYKLREKVGEAGGGRAAFATTCVASACARPYLGNGVQNEEHGTAYRRESVAANPGRSQVRLTTSRVAQTSR
jgi:hypothetical protein